MPQQDDQFGSKFHKALDLAAERIGIDIPPDAYTNPAIDAPIRRSISRVVFSERVDKARSFFEELDPFPIRRVEPDEPPLCPIGHDEDDPFSFEAHQHHLITSLTDYIATMDAVENCRIALEAREVSLKRNLNMTISDEPTQIGMSSWHRAAIYVRDNLEGEIVLNLYEAFAMSRIPAPLVNEWLGLGGLLVNSMVRAAVCKGYPDIQLL